MRLPLSCMQCLRESGQPSDVVYVEFRDDSRYEFTCPAGHVTTTVLQEQKFEVLFEIGTHAIADGYYREAVSSFTSALERFYEFAIRVLLWDEAGKDRASKDELFQQCWKSISRQSERQLGAFVSAWALVLRRKPELLPNAQVEFRNSVIHRGQIPTKEQALEYGDAVVECLRPQMAEIKRRFPAAVQWVTGDHIITARTDADRGRVVSTMSRSGFVSLVVDEGAFPEQTLAEYVDRLVARRVRRGTP